MAELMNVYLQVPFSAEPGAVAVNLEGEKKGASKF